MAEPLLSVQFSLAFECQRVRDTLEKLDWYRAQRYSINLPNSESSELVKAPRDRLIALVAREYDDRAFAELADIIHTRWAAISGRFFTVLSGIGGAVLQSSYRINLTRYGVGGSYRPPDTVIINISQRKQDRLIATIAHEIIHLSIAGLINEYRIEHWQNERLVDLIGRSILPNLFSLQRAPANAELIQRLFDQHYPDMGKVIRVLAQSTTERTGP